MNETITENEGKRTKQVMVRLPSEYISLVDEYVGITHSSRPDFIMDAARRYIDKILLTGAPVIDAIGGDGSIAAKQEAFKDFMAPRLVSEYREVILNKNLDWNEVSVLLSAPIGFLKIVDAVVKTGLFTSRPEFFRIATIYLLRRMNDQDQSFDLFVEFNNLLSDEAINSEKESIIRKIETLMEEIDMNPDSY